MKILILCGFYHSKLRFEGGRREALREGHSEQFGGEFMRFFDIVRGVFLCDLGAPWPPPKPIFLFFAFFLNYFKEEIAQIQKNTILGGRPGGVWGGWRGLRGSQRAQPAQPAS